MLAVVLYLDCCDCKITLVYVGNCITLVIRKGYTWLVLLRNKKDICVYSFGGTKGTVEIVCDIYQNSILCSWKLLCHLLLYYNGFLEFG